VRTMPVPAVSTVDVTLIVGAGAHSTVFTVALAGEFCNKAAIANTVIADADVDFKESIVINTPLKIESDGCRTCCRHIR
jgi:hypothetical protein